MNAAKKHIAAIVIGLISILFLSQNIHAEIILEERSLFGPLKFERLAGKPNEFNFTFYKFEPSDFHEPFRLLITNGDEKGQNRVSSAKIILNGVTVVSESQLNQNVGSIEIDLKDFKIQLVKVNSLQVILKSKPGSFITVSILGQEEIAIERVLSEVSGLVGPVGGSVSLDNFAKVTLANDPTRPELTLKVQKIDSPDDLTLYQGHLALFDAGPAWPELIKIILSESVQPDNTAVAVQVPKAFIESLGQDFEVELYAKVVQSGANNEEIATFDPLGAAYDEVQGIAYANIPLYAFNYVSSAEARLIIGSSPKNKRPVRIISKNISPSQTVYAGPMETIPLSATIEVTGPPLINSPLRRTLTETSSIGMRFHPTKKEWRPHKGVDLRSDRDDVYPVLPGRVIESGEQVPCNKYAQGLCKTGYGHYVLIDHGNGLKSLYAHMLKEGLPAVGDEVQTYDIIGKSDTSGELDGPHLHLEYRIGGEPVNPMAFIGWGIPGANIEGLSVVALVNGVKIEGTRQQVNSEYFNYSSELDLAPLGLPTNSTNTLSITLESASGKRVNLIKVPLIIACSSSAALTLTGPDDASVGATYTATGGTEPYTYSISGGSINAATGQITSLPSCTTGQPAKGTVTATDACGNTGTKDVRLPNGMWVKVSQVDCPYQNNSGTYFSQVFLDATHFRNEYLAYGLVSCIGDNDPPWISCESITGGAPYPEYNPYTCDPNIKPYNRYTWWGYYHHYDIFEFRCP